MKKPKINDSVTIAIVQNIISKKPHNEASLMRANRSASREFSLPPLPKRFIAQTYKKLCDTDKIEPSDTFNHLLKVRAVRTLSGVAPITVLTKPYPCPGKCVYCPTENGMPKSYLSNEPAAQRAVRLKFDPFQMVARRLQALINNGHAPEKIELLVLGGTWSSYPWRYQKWFIKRCFEAANYFPYTSADKKIPKIIRSYTLAQAQTINEASQYKIIGLTLETRPDWVTDKEIIRLRELGCTRVQLGAQILDDEILDLIKRGHRVRHLAQATKKLRDNGFKFDYHLMPNLPGATIQKDIETVKRVFTEDDFKPDQIKLYPTIVNEYAELYEWYKDGRYKPYAHEKLVELLIKLKQIVPYYCRINRLIRDIPGESIIAGNKVTNLRQLLEVELKKRSLLCKCIRCREVRNKTVEKQAASSLTPKLFMDKYKANGGDEYFISYESKNRDALYAFIRLRIPGKTPDILFDALKGAGLIRELHTYGQLQTIGAESQAVQHKGLGKQLMQKAETIIKKHGLKKSAVIAGVGVRGYYRKLGYKLQNTYMVKNV